MNAATAEAGASPERLAPRDAASGPSSPAFCQMRHRVSLLADERH